MRTIELGPDLVLLETNHEYEVLFYKSAPIAGYSPLMRCYFTVHGSDCAQVGKYLKGAVSVNVSVDDVEQMGFLMGEAKDD